MKESDLEYPDYTLAEMQVAVASKLYVTRINGATQCITHAKVPGRLKRHLEVETRMVVQRYFTISEQMTGSIPRISKALLILYARGWVA